MKEIKEEVILTKANGRGWFLTIAGQRWAVTSMELLKLKDLIAENDSEILVEVAKIMSQDRKK